MCPNHPANPERGRDRRGGVVPFPDPPASPARPRPLLALVVSAAIGLLLAIQALIGCSSKRDYRVLSFFFDGVPDPNAPVVAPGDEFAAATGARPVAIMHKPFVDNQCDACHASSSGRFEDFDKADASSCGKCHQGVQTQFAVMHGPVAIGECLLCHVPHESTVPALLIDKAPAVCITCHDQELLPANPPDHLTDRSCLDCHTGHGADTRGMLRPDWTSAVTRPSDDAPATTYPAPTEPAPANIAPSEPVPDESVPVAPRVGPRPSAPGGRT